eukprot:663322-Amphidinium_carterae.3
MPQSFYSGIGASAGTPPMAASARVVTPSRRLGPSSLLWQSSRKHSLNYRVYMSTARYHVN